MATGGGWGFGKFGATLIWGYQLAGVLGKAIICSDAVKNALAQTAGQVLQYSATITIDGTDVSSKCSPFVIEHRGRGGITSAQFSILGTGVTVNLHESIVSISVGIADPATSVVYSQERFRGKAHLISPLKTAGSIVETVVTCYDLGYVLSEKVPASVADYQSGSFTGILASAWIDSELAAAGLGAASGSMVDYTFYAVRPDQRATARDAIYSVANGNRSTTVYYDPNGNLILTDFEDTTVSSFTFPLAAQDTQLPVELASGWVNQVIVRWWASDATTPAYHTGGVTVNDTADQADKGIIKKTPSPYIVAGGINYSDSDAVKEAAATVVGNDYMDATQQAIYRWTGPLNPFIVPGNVVTLTLADSSTKSVRIDDISESGGFELGGGGGFWAAYQGRATA